MYDVFVCVKCEIQETSKLSEFLLNISLKCA